MAIGRVKVNQYTLYLCWLWAASCSCSWSSSDLAWYNRLTCIHEEGERARVTACVAGLLQMYATNRN